MKLFILAIFLSLPAGAAATRRDHPGTQIRPPGSYTFPDDPEQDPPMAAEMRTKLAIERAEDRHRKAMEDVKKLGELSNEVVTQFGAAGKLAPDDLKKISTMEKLAKRILDHAGGNEFDGQSQPLTTPLAEAVGRLKDAVAKIAEGMEKETRYVVSAQVIASANEVIDISQHIRRTVK